MRIERDIDRLRSRVPRRSLGREQDLTGSQARILQLQATAGNAAVSAALATMASRSPAAGDVVQRQPARPIRYPGYRNIAFNATVRNEMWQAWRETVEATTPATRREQSFWIQWDPASLSDANGRYRVVDKMSGTTMTNDQDAGLITAPKPADDPRWHTVGAFHTHTPTRYRTTDAAGNAYSSRPAGATATDDAAHRRFNIVGIVRDYVGKSGVVPAGHPLWAESRYYHAGPERRI